MSIWIEFLSLATKWLLVNMNSQEWLVVKDQWCFPNVLAQLMPTHTISTWAASLIDRNEDELCGWEADIWRDEKNLKDHVSYNLNSFSSLMFLIIIQQLVFFSSPIIVQNLATF